MQFNEYFVGKLAVLAATGDTKALDETYKSLLNLYRIGASKDI
ncbi:hypothetical protein [Aneurinibacillus aneurinilyticus]|uniref:Uncharacterized protein n=1 Tax=Aneurinibacillus aneurinilyticus ATCC 12856 TaxID=649747 RepID=U1WXU0_ANEAE|nr:hypothetical protein [Aneurinibacillus aneurinilyticus]ERI07505.1 hypothetical protein HMPREF0083_04407 [Aneurinibacillus aneurinilyticus ATCC 12856]MED0669656.1 hypothetical protein [Aneurinibacillus aneurinilyticus]MED0709200.1 hypothetical protein [Aneurinibacillus aneurinilyticus]MED0721990.1 hypothetical protein [Aneurinibacillus aneurinilyticus]MED0732639.1 hypothetical protein [Aneurinibacillus aneurinilyticus]